ncbi:type II secretion system minor pseudopilin GspK [uncultured Psychrobacter sp.]|uniref:type II secretion system minor pseudopilin GspK n=1 Tax=uncultured Psychrobacter sp. TaxID=259303 RepID=UPI00345A3513
MTVLLKMPLKTPADSQRGVALLTILLLVVSITVVAGSMLASQKIVIRRSGLLFDQNQLLQDINAGQQLAVTLIRADDNLNDTDSAQDIWAQPLPPYTLGGHSLTIELRDEANRFNINNLYHDNEVDSAALEMFQRLLQQLNLDPDLATAVLDWQDADSEVYNDGGDESIVYAQQGDGSVNKIPSNQPFVSIDQLQNIRGVSPEVLASLRPYITAVPYFLPININTASSAVLAALAKDMTSEQMREFTDQRQQNVLNSVDDIWQLPPLNNANTEQSGVETSLLSVDSQAFMALITATDMGSLGAPKQRFATVLISKTRPSNDNETGDNNTGNGGPDKNPNNNATNNATNNANPNNNVDDDEQPKTVKVINQRLWAFRPAF